MRAKIARFQNLERVFQCPLCGEALRFLEGSLLCERGHCFDIAAKGYVNFLPNHGPAKGYDADFFENRRRFLEAGFYSHVADALESRIPSGPARVLDAGCGEGYYAARFALLPEKEVFGLDISKEALLLAARGETPVRWMVADVANLPFENESVDCLLNIFTPANYASFGRVLTRDGILIKAIPGPSHLKELRRAVGGQLQSQESGTEQTAGYFQRHFVQTERSLVSRTLPVTEEELEWLLRMTPLLFGVDKASVDRSGLSHITIEAEILIGKAPREV